MYSGLVYGFYVTYVPMIRSFQCALLPVLLITAVSTAVNVGTGLCVFIFAFPLISNLPYLFGIAEPIPHAPTVLVLFLFFFLGWMVNRIGSPSSLVFKEKIYRPMTVFSLLVLISAVITFIRYTHFFPFVSNGLYEWVVNVRGETSGGAWMSIVFFALSYLTSFAFFFIFLSSVRSRAQIKKVLTLLCISTLLALCFGAFQSFFDVELGNNPISIRSGMINATFKDGLSFGAYVSMIAPLLLGMTLAWKGLVRVLSGLCLALSLVSIFFIGSRSGLLALFVSLVVFALLYMISLSRKEKGKSRYAQKAAWVFGLVMVVLMVSVLFFQFNQSKILSSRTMDRLSRVLDKSGMENASRGRLDGLWKFALQMMRDYPAAGVGIGAYIIEVSNYNEASPFKVNVQSAENYFLQIGAELGWVGLFFVFWIFWEIIKKIKRGFSKGLLRDRNRFLFIGAVSGLAAAFLSLMVHTFIGSYEIKYAFWLLVAVVFLLVRGRGEAAEDKLFARPFRISAAAVLVLFAGFSVWSSTHSLSLEQRTEKFDLKQDFGFYSPEQTSSGKTFQWTGRSAARTLRMEKPVVSFSIHASHPDIQDHPVTVKIYLIKNFFREKRRLDEIVLQDRKWKQIRYTLPEEKGREGMLLFKVSRVWNPWRSSGIKDIRNLGVAVGEITFSDEK